MTNYKYIYEHMEPDKYYTAKELSVAGATMTAMIKRGLVTKKVGKPNTYCRVEGCKLNKILEAVKGNQADLFHLYRDDEHLGMTCMLKGDTVVDAFGKPFDISEMTILRIFRAGHKPIEIELN